MGSSQIHRFFFSKDSRQQLCGSPAPARLANYFLSMKGAGWVSILWKRGLVFCGGGESRWWDGGDHFRFQMLTLSPTFLSPPSPPPSQRISGDYGILRWVVRGATSVFRRSCTNNDVVPRLPHGWRKMFRSVGCSRRVSILWKQGFSMLWRRRVTMVGWRRPISAFKCWVCCCPQPSSPPPPLPTANVSLENMKSCNG